MTNEVKNITTERNTIKRLSMWLLLVVALLLIPYFAKFPWSAGDFVLAGTVLFGAALGYEMATKGLKDSRNRLIVGAVTLLMVLLIWGLAVVD